MSLEGILKKAVQRIREGQLNNEAQVKQSVIVPILRALDWDDSDPDECRTEFSVDNGRVDYALLRPDGHPLVFIEAKALGRATADGEEQVFRYAANKGVPFLILTDGDCWDFYLSMAAGPPADRRFYQAELTRAERIPEYVEFFEGHLQKRRVVSDAARRAAEELRDRDRKRQRARAVIPGVWRALLEEKPEEMLLLIDLLEEEVKKRCGTKPEPGDVEAYIRGMRSDAPPPADLPRRTPAARPPAVPPAPDPPDPGPETRDGKRPTIIGFELDGKPMKKGKSARTMVEILKTFSDKDPGFPERFALHSRTKRASPQPKGKNPKLAQNRAGMKEPVALGDEWFVDGNWHRWGVQEARELIEIACEVAGVKFGSELRLIERER